MSEEGHYVVNMSGVNIPDKYETTETKQSWVTVINSTITL